MTQVEKHRKIECVECEVVIVGSPECWGYVRPTDGRVILLEGEISLCPECEGWTREVLKAQPTLF